MADTHKVSVKNTSGGPRVLNGLNGPVLTHAGETTEGVEISDAELKIARELGYFEFDGKGADGSDGEKSLDKHTKAELIEIAEAEGVSVETDDNKADLVRKIEEARAST